AVQRLLPYRDHVAWGDVPRGSRPVRRVLRGFPRTCRRHHAEGLAVSVIYTLIMTRSCPARLPATGGRMPHEVFGYMRLPGPSLVGEPGQESQFASIEGHCVGRGWHLAEVFCDSHDAAGVPWLKRPGGRQLATRLEDGDHVVVAGGRWVW